MKHRLSSVVKVTLLLAFALPFLTASAQTPPTPDTTPAIISDITTSPILPNSMKVEWMTDEAAVYTFEYGTSQSYGLSAPVAGGATVGGTVTLASLLSDTTYYYCIHATDTGGNVSSSCDSFITAPAPDTTPSIISGVANEFLLSTTTKIVWVTDEPARSKLRYGKTTGLGSETALETASSLLHEMILTGLSPNTKYYYCVDATDVSGNKSDSCGHTFVTASEMVIGDIVPPVVSLLTATGITQSSAKITWTTNESTRVQVQYGLTIDYGTISSLSRSYSRTHTVNLYRLTPATLYHYRVRSVDRAGNVSLSGDETFTTAGTPQPSTPGVIPPPPPSFVDGASETGPVRTEQIRNYRNQSSDLRQKIDALPSVADASVMMPVLFGVARKNISPNFGDPRSGGRTHEGEDIMAVKGTPIVSPTQAVVLRTVVGPTEGNAIYTANPGGETFVYMHLDRYGEGVVPGLVLQKGALIGYVGNTGNASGGAAHLHFEIHNSNGTPVDPYPRLTGELSLQEKITDLFAIMNQSLDSNALSQFLVINFRSTFIAAQAAGIALPAQIVSSLASIPASASPASASSDLTLQVADIVALQNYLIARKAGPAAARLAIAGSTGNFGPLTKAALIEYQTAVGISPAAGYYGPITRAFIASHPLGGSQPTEPTTPGDTGTPVNLTRDLHLGLTGEDVRVLQVFLNTNGYAVAQTGAGSPGNESTYFGALTEAAVIRFQIVKAIKPTAGYVGPITRAAMAATP